jgi:ABC-2 type transport system ATP-binding protein
VTAIEVKALVKRYAGVTAVAGVSFAVERGQTVALLGGNGAGKTTTIAMILGLLTPTSGQVRVLGQDMAGRGATAARMRMNFQSPYVDLPKRLTVRQNLDIYARLYGVPRRKERIETLTEELALTEFIDRRTGSLSAGQGTRVGLAKALVNEPDLLLLDEPTASLDPDTADWMRTRLEAYAATRGAAVLLASHNMAEVERLAGRVLMMKAGRIVDDAAPKALIARYGRASLEEVFLDIARGGERSPERPAVDAPDAGMAEARAAEGSGA